MHGHFAFGEALTKTINQFPASATPFSFSCCKNGTLKTVNICSNGHFADFRFEQNNV